MISASHSVNERSQANWQLLHEQIEARAHHEGRTDSLMAGLRFYKFSSLMEYQKVQRLVPGYVVVVQGEKTAAIGGASYRYGARQSLVLSREMICMGTVVQGNAHAPYLALHLDLPPALIVKTLLAIATQDRALDAIGDQNAAVLPVDDQVLGALCRLIPATDSIVDRLTLAPLVLEEVVVLLIRSDSGKAIRSKLAVSRTALKVQESMQYIQAHFKESITVDSLAQGVAMSPSHYAHCFKEVCGVSPMRYLRDIRLNEACNLLAGQVLRTSEVASQVGFQSDAHFSREFKRRFEHSPAQYAQRLSVEIFAK
jgi:AraC-like DNA-binding protein